MQFIRVVDWQPGILEFQKRLASELKHGKKVVWLVSGGSNIKAACEIMSGLNEDVTENLTVLLTDERFGPIGHKDSNFKQLHDAGFEHKQAAFLPTLVEGLNLQETEKRYEELVERVFGGADVILGQIGMGADGHIAGILPHSPASTANTLVASYATPTYTRVTLTFEALAQLSAAYAFVFGADKYPALHKLQAENLQLQEQPAQLLNHLAEAYVYNDQIG